MATLASRENLGNALIITTNFRTGLFFFSSMLKYWQVEEVIFIYLANGSISPTSQGKTLFPFSFFSSQVKRNNKALLKIF